MPRVVLSLLASLVVLQYASAQSSSGKFGVQEVPVNNGVQVVPVNSGVQEVSVNNGVQEVPANMGVKQVSVNNGVQEVPVDMGVAEVFHHSSGCAQVHRCLNSPTIGSYFGVVEAFRYGDVVRYLGPWCSNRQIDCWNEDCADKYLYATVKNIHNTINWICQFASSFIHAQPCVSDPFPRLMSMCSDKVERLLTTNQTLRDETFNTCADNAFSSNCREESKFFIKYFMNYLKNHSAREYQELE